MRRAGRVVREVLELVRGHVKPGATTLDLERVAEARINELLAQAGLDMDRLRADLSAHRADIDGILKRNNEQAEAFGFRGTPSFIVGKFRVPGVLTMTEFEQVIADARKAKASKTN